MSVTKTQGHDFNFFQKVTCTWSNFGGGPGFNNKSDGASPDIAITFSTQGFILTNEDTSAIIEVSYNGTTVHDEINPAIMKSITYDNRRNSLMWFRLKTGGSAVISVRAWAIP